MITALRKALVRLPTSVVAYDIETSGLIPEYDQVLQVAALRTDQQFSVPVDETSTLELRARRQPWVVPSPTAMVVTRIDPDMLSTGLFHHELIAQTQKFFLETPSLFLTYNGIKFDERFMRNAFFRSLCRPYVTQTNGAMRADLMIIAQAISVLDPSAITVPISDKGRPTFRLGMMCRANGIDFPEETAHDALADVRATLDFASWLKRASPLYFDLALALADKNFTSIILGPGKAVSRLGVFAGIPSVRAFGVVDLVEDDSNARLCVDLTIDPDEYLGLSVEQLRRWTGRRPSPLATIRVNAHEMVFPLSEPDILSSLYSRIRRFDKSQDAQSLGLLERRAAQIARCEDFADRLHTLIAEKRTAVDEPVHVDEQLYSGGFVPNADYRLVERHRLSSAGYAPLINVLSDTRLREFAHRVAYEEDAMQLELATRTRMSGWVRERLLGPAEAPWRTIAAARTEIMEWAGADDEPSLARRAKIATWLNQLEAAAIG